MPFSKIDLCNQALSLISQEPLTDLNKEVNTADQCKIHYESAWIECLSTFSWSYCTQYIPMNIEEYDDGLMANDPNKNLKSTWPFNFKYRAALPEDIIDLWGIYSFDYKLIESYRDNNSVSSNSSYQENPAYHVMGSYLYTYVSSGYFKVTIYNNNIFGFNHYFITAFIHLLASKCCKILTGSSSEVDRLLQIHEVYLKKAIARDISIQSTQFINA